MPNNNLHDKNKITYQMINYMSNNRLHVKILPVSSFQMATLEGNREKLAEADKQLDVLEGMTGTMLNNANAINTELVEQNQMIDSTNEKMDIADQGIVDVTKKVEKIHPSRMGFVAYAIIALEIIAIIVLFIPF